MNSKTQKELQSIVEASYELTGEHFNGTRSKMAAADFLWAVGKINKEDVVLDLGCGNGRLLDYTLLTPDRYLGIDNSKNLLQVAKSRYPEYVFLKKDLNNLKDIPSLKFSIIFCSAVIIHIPGRRNRIKLLADWGQLAQPEAKLIISAWKMKGKNYKRLKIKSFFLNLFRGKPLTWRDLVFPWLDQDGKEACSRYYHYFSKIGLKRELKAAGWIVEDVLDDKYNFWFIARRKLD